MTLAQGYRTGEQKQEMNNSGLPFKNLSIINPLKISAARGDVSPVIWELSENQL